MNSFEEFKKRMDRKLNVMDAKISFMHSGMKELGVALKDFKEEFDLFIDFASEQYEDHEKRIRNLENNGSH